MPWWSAFEDYADKLHMTIPELLAWCEHGEGEWWLNRLRIKWEIQAIADRRQWADQERGDKSDATWTKDGWRGGHCDPEEFSVFADEHTDAA